MNTYDVSSKSLNELISLKGRTAVVTGGARGIGLSIVKRLAEAGANIAIGDLNLDGFDETIKQLQNAYGVKVAAWPLNVANSGAISSFIKQVEDFFDSLNIWVNNAGIYPYVTALDIDDAAYDKLMDINLKGTFVATRDAARQMIAQKTGGIIINIVSTAAVKTAGNATHYAASKHAVAGLTKGFARELGPQGVRVLAIAPTLVDTPGVAAVKQGNEAVKKGLEEFAKGLPLERAAYPDDIARVVLFAASDLAMFMSGSILFVDGGELTF